MSNTAGAHRLQSAGRPAGDEVHVDAPRQRAEGPNDRQGAAHAKSRAGQRRTESRKAPADVLALFGALIDAMPDAMAVVDQASTIVFVNARTERLFDYKREELLGKPVDILVPERFRNAHREHRSGYFRTPSLRLMGSGMDLVATRRDGKEFPVEISLSPIETIIGTLIICAIRDVTVQPTAQRAAERAKLAAAREANEHLVVGAVHAQMAAEKAERDSHLKDECLATVSHELRTPLNAILGWARVLESKRLSPERAEHATAAIGRSASALAHLIDDLLDTSRILTGAVRLALRPVDLAAVAQGALDAVRPLAATKNVHVSFEAVAGSRTVSGDADRLQQVIWNLLANAIKFTPEGGRVHVVIESVNDHMELRVVDTGCGISSDFLPHVFERFRQAEGATTQRHTGLGLGLGIVLQFVELHGGTVDAGSEGLGRGATFTIRLPIPADVGATRPVGSPHREPRVQPLQEPR
jgi:PAS domain S-box-containing protein